MNKIVNIFVSLERMVARAGFFLVYIFLLPFFWFGEIVRRRFSLHSTWHSPALREYQSHERQF